jgi:signal transduction histidine kinase
VPIFDEAGQLIGFRGSDRDVTDRVQAEQELRDAHKMEGIGRLAGGFAHHFNNLLQVIVGHVETAGHESASQAIDADLQAVREAAQRAALLTRQILAFAGTQLIKPRFLDLNEHIDGLRLTLRRVE